ncbi:MAG TPA: hypothetical protein VFQ61_06525 [Polyangiaceae bacterium]|nr:hypothetical protein [Polyangiaceae bacterium]
MDECSKLEDLILERVRDWFARAVPPLARQTHTHARLEIRIGDASASEDGSLYLQLGVSEELEGPLFDSDSGGAVPGVTFKWGRE